MVLLWSFPAKKYRSNLQGRKTFPRAQFDSRQYLLLKTVTRPIAAQSLILSVACGVALCHIIIEELSCFYFIERGTALYILLLLARDKVTLRSN